MKKFFITIFSALMLTPGMAQDAPQKGLMTAEDLWAMGRIGATAASADGKTVAYQVAYYSVKDNNSRSVIKVMKDGKVVDEFAGTNPAWIMTAEGKETLACQDKGGEGFLVSPDGKKVIILQSLPYNDIIQKNPEDLPKASGMVITDLNYRHWDHYVTEIMHPFLYDAKDVEMVAENGVVKVTPKGEGKDLLAGEPYECPVAPFGGIEQLAWSPDSKVIAYTSKKKTGRDYAVSTDTDIYLYDVETGVTTNICKSKDFVQPAYDYTKSLKTQAINSEKYADENVGYDMNPQYSPDGKYIAWQSMRRDGYESDRNRICVYEIATGKKTYVTESFDSSVSDFCWAPDSRTIYFIGVWHGCVNLYKTVKGEVKQLTDDAMDFTSLQMLGKGTLLMGRQSLSQATELYAVTPGKDVKSTKVAQLTYENKDTYDRLAFGKVEPRWSKSVDGKDILSWIILPPNFDPNKKYPTLLFCEGGPQSPVSQFWSYRWNFQIMAANGYIIVAPNRRGLPGFGSEWLEEISGHWTGKCQDDYLTAIDDACTLPYVDKDRLGCVGASFGGFSVYYLAGHHDKRFKAFISHDGDFNFDAMYTETEEMFFANWENDDAFWNKDMTENARVMYDNSPHKFVDKWDTPILCIHGEKDYRICATQGMSAFNAARLRGIPAELLLFPDENHWVLKPQNGILWQRTFFGWLKKWLN